MGDGFEMDDPVGGRIMGKGIEDRRDRPSRKGLAEIPLYRVEVVDPSWGMAVPPADRSVLHEDVIRYQHDRMGGYSSRHRSGWIARFG